MKRLMLCTALILLSAIGKLYAQENDDDPLRQRSATQRLFDPCDKWNIRFRDFVELKEGKLILDIVRINDYKYFMHMDSILSAFKHDIAFYNDSLENGTGHVRIDYVINEQTGDKKIRFKKYAADGESFVNINGNISKLKIEQDTVRIIIHKQIKTYRNFYEPYAIQATFLLNNYTNVDYVIAEQSMITHIMDTLKQAKMARYSYKDSSDISFYGWTRSSTYFRPYSTFSNIVYPYYKTIDGIAKNELAFFRESRKMDYLTTDLNIGMSLVRNTLAPSADLGLQIIKSWKKYGFSNDNNFGGLYFQPIFFFDRNAKGDFITNTNGFVNFHYGAETENTYFGLKLRKASFGVGYLVLNKGDYFKKNTFKLFSDLQLKNGFTLSPELIITDNGKQVFPGLTLKVF